MDRFNTFKLFIQEHKNKIIVGILFLVILSLSTMFFLNIDRKTKTKTESIVFSNLNLQDDNNTTNKDNHEYIYVDIKGEVNNPGVYSIESGKRVVDAINLAGGLKESSDTTLLNLSVKLTDQMVIIVYSKDDINNIDLVKKETEILSEICNEEIKNNACIINNPETSVVPNVLEKNEDIISDNSNQSSKVNINLATINELMTLPKIGNVKALSIISYRESNGNFKTIEDIKNVKGIGDTLFESIKEYITV